MKNMDLPAFSSDNEAHYIISILGWKQIEVGKGVGLYLMDKN
jgi:hypothetical protein